MIEIVEAKILFDQRLWGFDSRFSYKGVGSWVALDPSYYSLECFPGPASGIIAIGMTCGSNFEAKLGIVPLGPYINNMWTCSYITLSRIWRTFPFYSCFKYRFPRSRVLFACMNAKLVKWQNLISWHLVLTYHWICNLVPSTKEYARLEWFLDKLRIVHLH